MRRAGRVDANHHEIVAALEARGMSVQSLASVGSGVPDLLVGYHGYCFTLELKCGRGKVREGQSVWAAKWRGHYAVVRSPEEAVTVILRGVAAICARGGQK